MEINRIMKRVMVFCLCLFFSYASLSMAQILMSTPDTSADAGTLLMMPIRVTNVSGLNILSYQFQMNFKSTVIKPVAVSVEQTLSAPWDSVFYNFSESGTLYLGAMGLTPLVGAGTLVNVQFELIGQPLDSTSLVFVDNFIGDGSTPVQIQNGAIKINTNLINVTVTSNVPGAAKVLVDDVLRQTPYQAIWVKGTAHSIEAPSPQDNGNGTRYLYASWSDGGAQKHTVSSRVDVTFTANFNTQYYLTVSSNYGTPQGAGWYNAGATANFSVETQVQENETTRHNFVSWAGTGQGSYSGNQRQGSVVLSGPITERANWNNEYYLKVSSPYGRPYGEGWYLQGNTAQFGIDSTAILRATARYYFKSWTGQGNGSYSGENAQSSVVINHPMTETANWEIDYYVAISANPPGLITITGSGWYDSGTNLITATLPDTVHTDSIDYLFRYWLIDGVLNTENPLTVHVDSALNIFATYGYPISATITTNIGAGTTVLIDNVEYEAPYVTQWFSNDVHTIGVNEYEPISEAVRYAFVSWNTGTERIQTISPTQDVIYTAQLDTQNYLIVTTNYHELFTLDGSGWYNAGTIIEIKAEKIVEVSIYTLRFFEWVVNGESYSSKSVKIQLDHPQTAAAFYREGYNISGAVMNSNSPLEEVQLIITGTLTDTVHTNVNGEYCFKAIFEGDYNVQPYKPNYRFEPTSIHYGGLNSPQMDQNFAAFEETAVVQEPATDLPDHFELDQNFPNPFNSTTVIRYSIPRESMITIAIYNVLGQPVRTLISQKALAGTYSVRWDGTEDNGKLVPSGVYFYKLMTNGVIETKKMIMLE